MRLSFPLFLMLASSVFAQAPRQQGPEIITITPDTVVAVINGRNFTAGDFERITLSVPPAHRTLAATDPKAFLEQYAESLMLASEAEKAKLNEAFPYKDKINDARTQILAQAMVDTHTAGVTIPAEELKKYYESHRSEFKQARVKVIFVSRISQITNLADGKTKDTSPKDAEQKAQAVAKKAKDGADFVQLARENSDDRSTADKQADLPAPIRANARNIPEDMRKAILSAKAGEIVGPIEHQTGYYIFRVESIEVPEFSGVKQDIESQLREQAVREWMAQLKTKTSVSLQNDAFWTTFKAANQQQSEKQDVAPKPSAKPQGKSAPEVPVAK